MGGCIPKHAPKYMTKLDKETQLRELLSKYRFGTEGVQHILLGHPKELDELIRKIMEIFNDR